MLVLISLLCAFIVLIGLSMFSKQHHTSLQRKFDMLVLLRELLLLCRQHRTQTHLLLQSGQKESTSTLDTVFENMMIKSNQLVAIACNDNKPMYRIFQLNMKALHKNWTAHSVARNQIVHGKIVRHCMFLMDEIAIAWLVESGRSEVSDEYHMNWQQVLDSMEVLTQLRITIQDYHCPESRARINYYCDKMIRKLNQLSFVCPLSMGSPAGTKAMHSLTEITSSHDQILSEEEFYDLTSDISLLISQTYDQILCDMTKQLYQPLPNLVTN